MGKKKTNEEFVEQLKKSRPNLKPLEDYKGYDQKIKFKCTYCGYEFEAKPSILLWRQASFCKRCSSWRQPNDNREKNFFIKLKEFNDTVEITGSYINMDTEIQCRCKIHNISYFSKPNYLLRHYCCPVCKQQNKSKLYRKLPYNKENFSNVIQNYKNKNLDILGTYVDDHTRIKCRCKICSGIIYKMPRNIYDGRLHRTCEYSKGEERISRFLVNNNIEFITQHFFEDLVGCGNGKLTYDFYLPQYNLLIEYQGEQHERPVEYFGGLEQFKIQQQHDCKKREYATQHKIRLLEIWHYDFDDIEQILSNVLITQAA